MGVEGLSLDPHFARRDRLRIVGGVVVCRIGPSRIVWASPAFCKPNERKKAMRLTRSIAALRGKRKHLPAEVEGEPLAIVIDWEVVERRREERRMSSTLGW